MPPRKAFFYHQTCYSNKYVEQIFNTSIKSFFALEEENILLLSKYMNLSDKEKIEVKSLKRGESLMMVGEEHILVNIEAAEYEKNIIERGEL